MVRFDNFNTSATRYGPPLSTNLFETMGMTGGIFTKLDIDVEEPLLPTVVVLVAR